MDVEFNLVNLRSRLDSIDLRDGDIDIAEVATDYGDMVASLTNLGEKSDDQDGDEAGFEDSVTHKNLLESHRKLEAIHRRMLTICLLM